MNLIRLNHFLSLAGVCSRRAADTHITAGHVAVNGKVIKLLGSKIDDKKDIITFNGKKVEIETKKIVYALNKPRGVTSTSHDKNAAQTVIQLVPKTPRVFSIGRLDRESEGLLLLTNDGDLANKLMHPSTHVKKIYQVICIIPREYERKTIEKRLQHIRRGVTLDGEKTQPAEVTLIGFVGKKHVELQIGITEGKKRQIRRSMGKIELEVQILRRIQIGGLTLDELHIEPGKWVQLTDAQIEKLYN